MMNPNITPIVRKPVGYGPAVLERRPYTYGSMSNFYPSPRAWSSSYAAASATAKRRCDRQRRQFGRSHRWGTPFGAYRQRAFQPPFSYPRSSLFGRRYPYPYSARSPHSMDISYMPIPLYRRNPFSHYASTLARPSIPSFRSYPHRRYRTPPFFSYHRRQAYQPPPEVDDDDVLADDDDGWGDSDDEDDLYDSSWDHDIAEDDDIFHDHHPRSHPFSSFDNYSAMCSDYEDDDYYEGRATPFYGQYSAEHPYYPYARR